MKFISLLDKTCTKTVKKKDFFFLFLSLSFCFASFQKRKGLMGFRLLFLALRTFGIIASTNRDKTDLHEGQTPKDS